MPSPDYIHPEIPTIVALATLKYFEGDNAAVGLIDDRNNACPKARRGLIL